MKGEKMKKLLLVMVILAVSAPGFGAVLVYKVSETLKGYRFTWNSESFVKDVNGTPDVNDANAAPPLSGSSSELESAKAESMKFAGYIVMDVNVGSLLINDANTGVALVLVDKTAKTYTVMRTVTDANGIADPNFGDVHGTLYATSVLDKNGNVTKQEAALFDCVVFKQSISTLDVNDPNKGIGTADEHSTLNWGFNNMIGKLSLVDITGAKVKVSVPKSLKGQGSFNKLKDSITSTVKCLNSHVTKTTYSDVLTEDDVFAGTTIKLDTKLTKNANGQDFSFTAAVADLITQLKAKGYTEAAL